MIDYSVDGDGVATISWNMTGRPMNVMNDASVAAFAEKVKAAIADKGVKGVIVASAKEEFIAGADLTVMTRMRSVEQSMALTGSLNALFRAMEKSGKPFVAAINGSALGGGYEVALACHRRIAADRGRTRIGLPEVKIGLLPGAGGTQRLPRMIGIRQALPLLLEGKTLDPKRALAEGMIDAVVTPDRLLAEAKNWILTEGPKNAVKPWDKKGYRLPDAVQSPKGYETFIAGNAMLRAKTQGNYPSAADIMSCVYEGCQVDIDTGLRIESRRFAHAAASPQARNMIRTLFFGINDANKLAGRPDAPPSEFKRVGVLGAGFMGSGIAYVSAMAGLEVVLIDASQAQADKGKAYSQGLLDKQVAQKRVSSAERDAALARITATTDYAVLKGCDLVIEAVFEDRALKAEVTRKAEAMLAPGAVFASNTSTIPITGLAEASARPGDFIGLHFFSPVDKMPLVEIIRGQGTTGACLAKAMDYVKRIRKTPIVVNDSRGFYTSRVVSAYILEGMMLLAEGVAPALIENAGRMAGMPVGPLSLADEVAIDLLQRIRLQTRKDLGGAFPVTAADGVIELMAAKLGRHGRKAGKGFYDYPADGEKRLWPGLKDHFKVLDRQPAAAEVMKRLMYVQSVETSRCIEEKVVTSPKDADVGSVLGWGFAPFMGGTVGQIHTLGVKPFVAECDLLAKAHGPRFTPPQLLRDMAARGESFYTA